MGCFNTLYTPGKPPKSRRLGTSHACHSFLHTYPIHKNSTFTGATFSGYRLFESLCPNGQQLGFPPLLTPTPSPTLRRYLSENDSRNILTNILEALAYLHSQEIVHRVCPQATLWGQACTQPTRRTLFSSTCLVPSAFATAT